MNSELFQLDFSRIPIVLLTIVSVAINIFIFIYVSLFLSKTRVKGYFSFFVFSLGLWQLTEGLVKLSVTAAAADQWNRITLIFVLINVVFGFLFAITFTKVEKYISWNIIFLTLILPLLFFIICSVLRLDQYIAVQSEQWYWVVNPSDNLITHLIYFWITFFDFGTLLMFLIYYFKKGKEPNEHKQSLLIVIGFSIPAIFGIIFESIFPVVFNINGIPITSHITTVFSVLSLIAIKKYHMLDFSPKHQWDDIVNTMNEGILIVDVNEKIKYANEAFCTLLGYDFAEIENKYATELLVKDNLEKERMMKRIEQRTKSVSDHYEIQLVTKTGEKKWLLVGASPYFDKDGNIVGSFGIHSDITSRKATEQNLIDTNNELEIFIYKASHDLRGPLASIIGLVNISNSEIKDETALQYMNMIGTSTQKLDHTLKELVKTMKIKDTERFDDLIDFNDLIDAKLSEFNYFSNFDKLKITANVMVLDKFYSNRFLIETILHNLIENSIKYQSANSDQSFLKISVSDYMNGVQLIIEDNGIGIKSSVQGLIFDMYYKAVETSKGSGLGLYLVKKCVEKLNGEIELRSSLGKGSVFSIYLKNKDWEKK